MASAPINAVALLVPADVFGGIKLAATRLNKDMLSALRLIVRTFISSHLPPASAESDKRTSISPVLRQMSASIGGKEVKGLARVQPRASPVEIVARGEDGQEIPWRYEKPTSTVTENIKCGDIKVEVKEECGDDEVIGVSIPGDAGTPSEPWKIHSTSCLGQKDFLCQSPSQSSPNTSTSGVEMPPVADDEDFQRPPKPVRGGYWCHVCRIKVIRRNAWKDHMRLHRPGEIVSKCTLCPAIFPSNKELKLHMAVHKHLKCNLCDIKFGYKYALKKHMLVHAGVVCAVCNQSCMDKEKLRQHSRTHIDHNPYSCGNCNARFDQQFRLIIHMNSHAEKDFRCDHCDVTYATRGAFMKHRHSVEWPRFKCDRCDAHFPNQSSWDSHMHHHSISQDCAASAVCASAGASQTEEDRTSGAHSGDQPSEYNQCDVKFEIKEEVVEQNSMELDGIGVKVELPPAE